MSKRILITDKVHNSLIEKFQNQGWRCDYEPDILLSQVHDIIQNYNGAIINSKILFDQSLIDKSEQLEFIGRLGSGMEIIDQEYASTKGIKCFNVPEGNANAVAEHTLGLLLTLTNNLYKSYGNVRELHWNREPNRGDEVEGKTVGIIGYGYTGKAIAKLLKGFDVTILAYDKYLDEFSDEYVRESSMEEIFEQTDILSIHLPLTDETKYIIDSTWINQFAKPIYFVNTSRGKIVRTSALLDGLQSGKLKGVGLDVLENEKLEIYSEEEKNQLKELMEFDHVMITPHIAGWTYESLHKIASLLADKIIASYSLESENVINYPK